MVGQRGYIASKCLKNNQTKEIQKKELHAENLHFGKHSQSTEKQIVSPLGKNYTLSLSLHQWNKASYLMMVAHEKTF